MTAARPMLRSLERALVVDDDADLCRSLARVIRDWGAETHEAHTLAEAREALATSPDLMLVDVCLRNESGIDLVLEATRMRPSPVIVAISGRASPDEGFVLGRLGVRAYLAKPITRDALIDAVQRAMRELPDLDLFVKAHVGRTPLRALNAWVRDQMIAEALALTKGSRAGAAKLLRVSRQAMQQVMRARRHREGSA